MRVELAWWDLGAGDPDADELAASPAIQQAFAEWDRVPNLTTKLWLISRDAGHWGALMLWHGEKPDRANLPRNISAELIGRPPDHRIAFDVVERPTCTSTP
jgi:hypothetical protein